MSSDFGPPPQLWLPPKPAIIRPRYERPKMVFLGGGSIVQGNFLPGWFPAGAMATTRPPNRLQVDSASSSSDVSSYNFGTQDFGAETNSGLSRSLVIVAITATDNANERTFTSCSIGGTNGTVVQQNKSSTNPDSYTVIVSRAATGTTGNVTVAWSSFMGECAIGIYALYGLNSTTAFHSNGTDDVDSASSISTTLNIPATGLAIACAKSYVNNVAHTATGLTEDLDFGVEGRHHYMSDQSMSAETGRTITSTGTANAARSISAASWF